MAVNTRSRAQMSTSLFLDPLLWTCATHMQKSTRNVWATDWAEDRAHLCLDPGACRALLHLGSPILPLAWGSWSGQRHFAL